jgi:hypothetical protein
MGKAAINDLANQYQRSFRMLYSEIERFDEAQWVEGILPFQVPVKVAMHMLNCLDYYFSGMSPEEYQWGHQFGGGWWELSDDELPDKDAVLAYARELEGRVADELSALEDEDLSRPFEIDISAATLLGHYIYAIRHTMHHHGELAALSIYHGNEGGSWH